MYNLSYYEKMLRQNSGTAELISDIRWKWVRQADPKVVLDYGSGCNFLTLFKPEDVVVDSYDIGTINGFRYPQTGIRHNWYDLIFFNDVLEHVDWKNEPDNNILDITSQAAWISVSVPILPKEKRFKGWKHNKAGEHLTVFTEKDVIQFFDSREFFLWNCGTPECPPREDVWSFLFKRM